MVTTPLINWNPNSYRAMYPLMLPIWKLPFLTAHIQLQLIPTYHWGQRSYIVCSKIIKHECTAFRYMAASNFTMPSTGGRSTSSFKIQTVLEVGLLSLQLGQVYSDTGKMVKQLLYSLHPDSSSCSSEGPPFATTSISRQGIWNPYQGHIVYLVLHNPLVVLAIFKMYFRCTSATALHVTDWAGPLIPLLPTQVCLAPIFASLLITFSHI